MTDKEVLLDLLRGFADWVHFVVSGMSLDALQWQPDEEANNIAVMVWHLSRAFYLLKVRILENQSFEMEQWYTRGWAAKTGYDPHGIGFAGFGNLGGYTQAEVRAVPILSADELLLYFDQACKALYAYLQEMPAEILCQPPAGWPDVPGAGYAPQTAYACIRDFLMDGREHLGEIKAIKAMWQRRNRDEKA